MVRVVSAVGFFVVMLLALAGRIAAGQEEPAHEHGGHEPRVLHDEQEIHRAIERGDHYVVRDRPNFLVWLIGALGWRYLLLLPASALLSFTLVALLAVKGKGKTTGAAMAFIVAIPFLVGLLGMFDGLISSFMVIAASDTSPKPSAIAEGISTSIVTPLVGMFLMAPSFLLATVGLTIRALQTSPSDNSQLRA